MDSDPAAAANKLLASYKLEPKTSTLVLIGLALHKANRFSEAMDTDTRAKAATVTELTTAQAALDAARAKGDSAATTDAEEAVRKLSQRAAALDYEIASLANLTARVTLRFAAGAPPAGLGVARKASGAIANPFAAPIVVDGGSDLLVVTYPNGKTKEIAVHVAGGHEDALTIPELDAPPAPGEHPPVVLHDAVLDHPTVVTGAEPARHGSSLRTWAYVAGGVGGASLVASIFIGLDARSKYSQSQNMHCDANEVCDSTGFQLATDAIHEGNVATVFGIAGLVGVGAGTALWLWSRGESAPPRTALVPVIDAHGAGLVVRGRL